VVCWITDNKTHLKGIPGSTAGAQCLFKEKHQTNDSVFIQQVHLKFIGRPVHFQINGSTALQQNTVHG